MFGLFYVTKVPKETLKSGNLSYGEDTFEYESLKFGNFSYDNDTTNALKDKYELKQTIFLPLLDLQCSML